jgi:hypothetical protein
MKLYLQALSLFLLLAYLADTRITLWPFSINFCRLYLVLGIIAIMCGCVLLKYDAYDEGLKKGAQIKEEVREEIKEQDIKSEL